MNKTLRALRYACWAVVALLLLALGIMSTPWFQRALERRIIARIEEFSGGRVEVAAMRFRPFLLQVVFQGFAVHGSEPAGSPPLFSARNVVAGFEPPVFFRRPLRMRSLEWDHAEIHLRTNRDGSTNIPGPRLSFEKGEALENFLDLSVGRLTVTQTTFFWNDQRVPLDFESQDVAVLLHLRRGRRYEGSLASTGSVLKIFGRALPPITFTSQFELSRGTVAAKTLTWRSRGFTGQSSFNYSYAASPNGYLTFQTSGDAALLAEILGLPELRGGNLRAEGRAVYRDGKYSAEGRVEAHELVVQGPQFRAGRIRVSANYYADPQRVEFSNLTVSALGGEARGKAQIALPGAEPHVALQLDFHGMDWTSVLGAFPNTPAFLQRMQLTSRINGTSSASWKGQLRELKADFRMKLFAPPAEPPGSIPFQGYAYGRFTDVHGLALELTDAKLDTRGSSLAAHGTLGAAGSSLEPNRLAFQVSSTDFREWQPLVQFLCGRVEPLPLSFKAPARFTGELSGPLSAPKISGRVESGEFDFQGWTWDGFAANVVATPTFAKISSGRLQHNGSSLGLEASASLRAWQLAPDSAVQVSAHAERTPLAGLQAALGVDYPLTGDASGRINLNGRTADLKGGGEIQIDQGTIAREPFDLLTAQVHVTNSVWDFDSIAMRKGRGQIKGHARFAPSTRVFSGELHAEGFSLAEVQHLAAFQNAGQSPRLDGQIALDLRAQGTPENFEIHGTWNVTELSLGGNPLGALQGQIDSEARQLQIRGQGQGPAGSLRFSGTGRIEEDWPVKVEGQFTDSRLDPLIRYFMNGKFDAQVLTSGSFQLSGPLKQPEQIELTSQVQTLEVNFPSLQWKNDQPVELKLAKGVVTASRFHMRGASTDLVVEGSVRLSPPGVLAVTAQGKADATLLSLLDPALKATGHSELKVQVSGRPAQPLLNGTVDVQDVSLTYGDLPFRISGLNGQIRLEGERANLRSLHGISGGGSVTLGGFIALSSPPRFEVRVDLDQVRLRYPTEFTSVLNGSLRLVGTPERGQLLGELTVRQMFANENINWFARIAEAGHPFEEQTPGVASPLASNIRLGVQVTSAPPVRLETGDIRLVADIDMRLQGTLANPVQIGTIRALSGEGVFRGNRYKLTRGGLNFTNPARTLAYLDLEAQTRVQQYELTLDISGPFDHLKFAYRSDPPLPATDILSLLALGYSRQQEETATMSGHPFPTVGASAILSEALSSQMTGRIQRLFGVSRIKIDPNVGLPGFASGARVTVEQQLTRELTLTYVTNTAASQYRIIQFEWALSDSVSLLGVRDQNGIFGLEFKFRQRFK